MTCKDCAEFLVDYIDGALPALVHHQFEAHLRVCPDCVTYLQQYRDTILLTAIAGDTLLEIPEELVQAITAAARG